MICFGFDCGGNVPVMCSEVLRGQESWDFGDFEAAVTAM